jgi:hypothetical protein
LAIGWRCEAQSVKLSRQRLDQPTNSEFSSSWWRAGRLRTLVGTTAFERA